MSQDFEAPSAAENGKTARQTTEARWRAEKLCPPGASQLESENNSSRWLRRVRPAVSVQGGESEVRILVHKAPVLSAYGEASCQGIISTGSVEESTFSLTAGPGHRSAGIARRIEDQTAAPSEGVRTDPSDAQWKLHHQIAGDRVHVGLHSGFSETPKISLSILVEAIISFGGKPAVDVIAVSHLESARICCCPREPLAVCVLREKPGALNTDFRAAFLTCRSES